jgi:hypothetical protein
VLPGDRNCATENLLNLLNGSVRYLLRFPSMCIKAGKGEFDRKFNEMGAMCAQSLVLFDALRSVPAARFVNGQSLKSLKNIASYAHRPTDVHGESPASPEAWRQSCHGLFLALVQDAPPDQSCLLAQRLAMSYM